jgi:hypothetical protein
MTLVNISLPLHYGDDRCVDGFAIVTYIVSDNGKECYCCVCLKGRCFLAIKIPDKKIIIGL